MLICSLAILRKLQPRGYIVNEPIKTPKKDALAMAAANPLSGKEDNGVAQDQPDEGITGLLGKVNLGSKREADDEASESEKSTNGAVKAVKVDKTTTNAAAKAIKMDKEITNGATKGIKTNKETKEIAKDGDATDAAGAEEEEL